MQKVVIITVCLAALCLAIWGRGCDEPMSSACREAWEDGYEDGYYEGFVDGCTLHKEGRIQDCKPWW